VQLICRTCKAPLSRHNGSVRCKSCGRHYPVVDDVLIFREHERESWSEFYDGWHVQTGDDDQVEAAENRKRKVGRLDELKTFLKRSSLLVALHDRLYFHECRKSWFLRKCFRAEHDPTILDLGCGKGYPILTDFGRVAGVDLSQEALGYNARHHRYELLVQSDLCDLPFDDEQFDVVVSVFVYGHIENESKDVLLQEVSRVLKPNGRVFMIIETDNDNAWLSFAKRFPELYWNKVIMQYGHIGLEYPQDALRRFRENGFIVQYMTKTWGPIWSVSDYLEVFDNEYVEKSRFIRNWVRMMRYVAGRRRLEILTNAMLGIGCQFYDSFGGLDQTMGLMLLAQKKA